MLQDFFYYSKMEWLSLLYLGIFGTVLGFVWYYEGIKAIGPMKASQFINFVPISAIVLAFLILGEPVTPSLLVGTILVCSGVYLTNRASMQ
jgi:drug/metabolite transporter (DMT)-like permease